MLPALEGFSLFSRLTPQHIEKTILIGEAFNDSKNKVPYELISFQL